VIAYYGYYDASAAYRQVTMPFGGVVLILSFGDPLLMRHPAGDGDPEVRNSFIAGLHDSHGIIESAGVSHGIQVDLTPLGAHLLTGLPMHLLANRALDLDDVFGAEGGELVEGLAEVTSWAARFAVLDAFIQGRIAESRPPSGVLWAYRTLSRTAGSASIGSLADSLGYSRKHLITQFREHVGLPPKTFARILRFDRAVQTLRRTSEPDLTRVAVDCGYFDQAHFNKEFREFSGMTPGEFVARRVLPFGGAIEPIDRQG
jgi:AraC-like DNA-binding protein